MQNADKVISLLVGANRPKNSDPDYMAKILELLVMSQDPEKNGEDRYRDVG